MLNGAWGDLILGDQSGEVLRSPFDFTCEEGRQLLLQRVEPLNLKQG